MEFPAQIKDLVFKLLQEPTLEKFREFIKNQTGEHDSIDFKAQWIESAHLAKEMLAMANSKGGVIVFGISENDDCSANIQGLGEIRDHATISNDIKKYIPTDLKYEVYDFSYDTSEYEALQGKHFQLLMVEDTPQHIPFLAKKEGANLKENAIYIRRGTSCEIANQEELRNLINRRINFIHPVKGEPLQLDEHLHQLKILYESIEKQRVYYKYGWLNSVATALSTIADSIGRGEKVIENNPLYPEEEYEAFIARMIVEKKKKIERVLDLY